MSKVIQVVLPDDQREMVELLLKVTGTKMSTLGRRLLLDWVIRTIDMPGTLRGGRCGFTRASGPESTDYCATVPAVWYMTTWKRFVCEECAKHLNANVSSNIAVLASDTQQPALNLEIVRAEIGRLVLKQEKTDKTDDELWEDIVRAVTALQARKFGGAPSFDALLDRFKLDS